MVLIPHEYPVLPESLIKKNTFIPSWSCLDIHLIGYSLNALTINCPFICGFTFTVLTTSHWPICWSFSKYKTTLVTYYNLIMSWNQAVLVLQFCPSFKHYWLFYSICIFIYLLKSLSVSISFIGICESIAILTIFSLPVHKHKICFHLLGLS